MAGQLGYFLPSRQAEPAHAGVDMQRRRRIGTCCGGRRRPPVDIGERVEDGIQPMPKHVRGGADRHSVQNQDRRRDRALTRPSSAAAPGPHPAWRRRTCGSRRPATPPPPWRAQTIGIGLDDGRAFGRRHTVSREVASWRRSPPSRCEEPRRRSVRNGCHVSG